MNSLKEKKSCKLLWGLSGKLQFHLHLLFDIEEHFALFKDSLGVTPYAHVQEGERENLNGLYSLFWLGEEC
uniref:Uncharacterized protein n=1 Tax=Arundo donax TaxID=35708 RepID=A0A0A9H8G5_ARUDO